MSQFVINGHQNKKKEKESEEETKVYLEISLWAQIFRGLIIDFLHNITLKDNI